MKLGAYLFLLLGMAPAKADNHPAFLPQTNVTVNYTVSVPGRADTSYQLEYDASTAQARINDPALGNYFLVDLHAGTAQMVVPGLHSVVNAPDLSALTKQIADAGQARFTPLGTARYAGLDCDKYLVLNDQGTGVACLTPDGVILHFNGHDSHGAAEVTATSVNYNAAPASDFAVPDGFSSINLPPGALQQLLGQ